MVNITPEEVLALSEEYQKRLEEMSPVERFDAENFSLIGDLPLLKDIPINQKAFLLDLIPGVRRIGKYDAGDLQPDEIRQLNKLILEATKRGQTSGRISYYDQGGYGDIITKDSLEQLQRQIKSKYDNPENVKKFLEVNSGKQLVKIGVKNILTQKFLLKFSKMFMKQLNISINLVPCIPTL